MKLQIVSKTKAKPFLKWAGGKTQLLPSLDLFLPKSFRNEKSVTYIEPFVGGGAMLFFLLQKYHNIQRAVINDINPHLINTYRVVRDHPYSLIDTLYELQEQFRKVDEYDAQKDLFQMIRQRFNDEDMSDTEEAAYMIFLNRTCFNGLYRENKKGEFNVPFGKYSNPTICDEQLLLSDSELLQRVEILNDDFTITREYIDGYTLFYFDPPYRPLDATSNFNSYVKQTFDDNEQIRLNNFYVSVSSLGCHALLSNSDCKLRNPKDDFFDILYRNFFIERVYAKRSINSKASKRGALTELLIRNYDEFQGSDTNLDINSYVRQI